MTIAKQEDGSIHISYVSDDGFYFSKTYIDYTWVDATSNFLEFLKGVEEEELAELKTGEFWVFEGFTPSF